MINLGCQARIVGDLYVSGHMIDASLNPRDLHVLLGLATRHCRLSALALETPYLTSSMATARPSFELQADSGKSVQDAQKLQHLFENSNLGLVQRVVEFNKRAAELDGIDENDDAENRPPRDPGLTSSELAAQIVRIAAVVSSRLNIRPGIFAQAQVPVPGAKRQG